MGISQGKREKLHLVAEDFEFLESETRKLLELISGIFPLEKISADSWPFRFLLSASKRKYEFIFSAMGSVTIRPAKDEFRKHGPPIFYMSISKYGKNEFVWEGPLEVVIAPYASEIDKLIHESIAMYEESVLPDR